MYPTTFPEIDCISLTKALAAGCIPITSASGALNEKDYYCCQVPAQTLTSKPGKLYYDRNAFGMTEEELENFEQKAKDLIDNPPSVEKRASVVSEVQKMYDWSIISDKWV